MPAHDDLDRLGELVDRATIEAWLRRWERDIVAVDQPTARELFDDGVIGFGSRETVLIGLDTLVARQWEPTWANIEGYGYDYDNLHTFVSDDRLMAVALVPWHSTGFGADGSSFDRPGRATVVLRRETIDSPWLAIHTHMSLKPGTPIVSKRPAVSLVTGAI